MSLRWIEMPIHRGGRPGAVRPMHDVEGAPVMVFGERRVRIALADERQLSRLLLLPGVHLLDAAAVERLLDENPVARALAAKADAEAEARAGRSGIDRLAGWVRERIVPGGPPPGRGPSSGPLGTPKRP